MNWFNLFTLSLVLGMTSMCICYGVGVFIKFVFKKLWFGITIMPNKSKIKGNTFERELVKDAIAESLTARRAWGSNGKSLGLSEDVDLIVGNVKIQAKRRRKLPEYIRIPKNCDMTVIREDKGETYALLRWKDVLDLLYFIDGEYEF